MDLGGDRGAGPRAFQVRIGIHRDDCLDFLLRDTGNPSSVMSSIETARSNADGAHRAGRAKWESINEAWDGAEAMLGGPIDARDLPNALSDQAADGADPRTPGTGSGTDFDFSQLGTFVSSGR